MSQSKDHPKKSSDSLLSASLNPERLTNFVPIPNEEDPFLISRRGFVVSAAAAGAFLSLPLLNKAFAKSSETMAAPVAASTRPAFRPIDISLLVNGQTHELKNLDTRTTLLDALREHLELTGSKKGCDHGQCGACTVIVNGKRINSCLSLAAQNQGKEILTVEGLEKNGKLHPMQQAFMECDAFQCGFCTPGQIMSAVALLGEKCGTSEAETRECMSGNICRCGAYRNILDAINKVRGLGVHKGAKNAAV